MLRPGNIKNSYLRLKQQYEQSLPETDKNHISSIQYQAISEAYAILSDIKRREIYDRKLITDRQYSYAIAEEKSGSSFIKAMLLIALIAAGWFGYTKYQNAQQRELHRIELAKEEAKLKQEEFRLAAENAELERERIQAAQQDARARERSQTQAYYDSRRLAADTARAEDAERRRIATEERERARQEAEWQRREANSRYGQTGPVYIRR